MSQRRNYNVNQKKDLSSRWLLLTKTPESQLTAKQPSKNKKKNVGCTKKKKNTLYTKIKKKPQQDCRRDTCDKIKSHIHKVDDPQTEK